MIRAKDLESPQNKVLIVAHCTTGLNGGAAAQGAPTISCERMLGTQPLGLAPAAWLTHVAARGTEAARVGRNVVAERTSGGPWAPLGSVCHSLAKLL